MSAVGVDIVLFWYCLTLLALTLLKIPSSLLELPIHSASKQCSPEGITNLLPHDTNLLPHDGLLIFDALVVLEPIPTNRKRKATAFGIEEDFRCISEDEAVKSNDMADLFHRSTTYIITAQHRKLAAIQDVDKQKSLAVCSNYVRVLEQDLSATKLRVETQNRLEKFPLANFGVGHTTATQGKISMPFLLLIAWGIGALSALVLPLQTILRFTSRPWSRWAIMRASQEFAPYHLEVRTR